MLLLVVVVRIINPITEKNGLEVIYTWTDWWSWSGGNKNNHRIYVIILFDLIPDNLIQMSSLLHRN